jgi:hypothetical protein
VEIKRTLRLSNIISKRPLKKKQSAWIWSKILLHPTSKWNILSWSVASCLYLQIKMKGLPSHKQIFYLSVHITRTNYQRKYFTLTL